MAGRFIPSAKEKWVFAPSVVSLAAPTRLEINAGVVICNPGVYTHEGLLEGSGWESMGSFVEVPDLATDTIGKIPGKKSTGDASLTFYDSDSGHPVRTALAEGSSGVMIRMRYGDVPTEKASVWPVTVNGVNDSNPDSGNTAKTFTVQFAITSQPAKDAVIPA